MQHIVIRRESYVAGTRERPEVGIFTQTDKRRRPVPWGCIRVNDTVWMKWQSGPIVARSSVKAFRQLDECTPGQLRAATVGYRLHDLPDYWVSLPTQFHAVVVYLKDEQWLETPIEPQSRAYGGSWFVLDTDERTEAWLGAAPLPRIPRQGASRRVSTSLRFAVLRRDSFRCQYCGRQAPDAVLHVDHVVPWSRGGPTELANLVTACQECNLGKGVSRVAESAEPYQTRKTGC